MTAIVFTIPGKPVPKKRPRAGKGGHFYTPKATRDYEAHVNWHAFGALAKLPLEQRHAWPRRATFEVELRVVPGSAAFSDVDNVAKSILDGCNAVLWDDDKQVAKLTVERAAPERGPHVVVRVTARTA